MKRRDFIQTVALTALALPEVVRAAVAEPKVLLRRVDICRKVGTGTSVWVVDQSFSAVQVDDTIRVCSVEGDSCAGKMYIVVEKTPLDERERCGRWCLTIEPAEVLA